MLAEVQAKEAERRRQHRERSVCRDLLVGPFAAFLSHAEVLLSVPRSFPKQSAVSNPSPKLKDELCGIAEEQDIVQGGP